MEYIKNTGERINQRGPNRKRQAWGRAPPSLWGPWQASGPLLLLYEAICPRKSQRKTFGMKRRRLEAETWAEALLISGREILPGKLPSGRGRSKPSSSPMLPPSWEYQSSSTSSPAPSHLKPYFISCIQSLSQNLRLVHVGC